MKTLKNLNELNLLELPLVRHENNNYALGIKECDLERYLISNNYNIYSLNALSQNEVIKNDLTVDSTLLSNIMDELGFSIELLKDETNLFYISNETESRYIEIIQEVCGAKPGLDYSISDSEDGELFSNIYVHDSKENDKEYKMIYSFENDNYVIKKYKMKVSGYYWINGKTKEDSIKNTAKMLNEVIKPKVIDAYGSFNDCKILDTQRYLELEEWDNEDGLCFENHFEVYINDIDIQEDTEAHYILESFFNTGLSLENE